MPDPLELDGLAAGLEPVAPAGAGDGLEDLSRRGTASPLDLAARAAALRAQLRPPEVTREQAAINAAAWKLLHPDRTGNPWRAESKSAPGPRYHDRKWWCECGVFRSASSRQCKVCRTLTPPIHSADCPTGGGKERRAKLRAKHKRNNRLRPR